MWGDPKELQCLNPLRGHCCDAPCKGSLVAVDKRPRDQTDISQLPQPDPPAMGTVTSTLYQHTLSLSLGRQRASVLSNSRCDVGPCRSWRLGWKRGWGPWRAECWALIRLPARGHFSRLCLWSRGSWASQDGIGAEPPSLLITGETVSCGKGIPGCQVARGLLQVGFREVNG